MFLKSASVSVYAVAEYLNLVNHDAMVRLTTMPWLDILCIFTSTPSLKNEISRLYRFGRYKRASEKILESFLPDNLNKGFRLC